ncbi:MAG: AAA family ATPase [Sphaerochaeta sp.]|jgi:MoxR-like ATPase|nr:AAA family ATPase [Sphaerochaeta sp.]
MKFVGSYVSQLKGTLAASAVSGHNVMLISAPGWGKTEMARAAGNYIAGQDGLITVELDPSTPPETIRGAYDPAALLNGQLNRLVDGTPYSPKAKVVLLDEVWRANDVVFDSLIHATNRKDIDPRTRPVFWGTSNFVGKGERTEALRDRFALWVWMEPDLDVSAVSSAHLFNGTGIDPEFTKGLPTWAECLDARSAVPTQRAAKVVIDIVEKLAAEAQANFIVNPRRVVQWTEILFRNTFLVTGTNDFQRVPDHIAGLLRYAYPAPEKETARAWGEVAASIADPVGAAIEAARAEILKEFRRVAAIKDIKERTNNLTGLGVLLANAQSNLSSIGGDDPRVGNVVSEINGWMVAAVNGKEIK